MSTASMDGKSNWLDSTTRICEHNDLQRWYASPSQQQQKHQITSKLSYINEISRQTHNNLNEPLVTYPPAPFWNLFLYISSKWRIFVYFDRNWDWNDTQWVKRCFYMPILLDECLLCSTCNMDKDKCIDKHRQVALLEFHMWITRSIPSNAAIHEKNVMFFNII